MKCFLLNPHPHTHTHTHTHCLHMQAEWVLILRIVETQLLCMSVCVCLCLCVLHVTRFCETCDTSKCCRERHWIYCMAMKFTQDTQDWLCVVKITHSTVQIWYLCCSNQNCHRNMELECETRIYNWSISPLIKRDTEPEADWSWSWTESEYFSFCLSCWTKPEIEDFLKRSIKACSPSLSLPSLSQILS